MENRSPSKAGQISPAKFLAATETSLDYSEFIFLSTGLIQYFVAKIPAENRKEIETILGTIRKLYLKTDYEEAIGLILDIMSDYQKELGAAYQKIMQIAPKLNEVEIYKNDSRRFFENRLAANYQRDVLPQSKTLDSISQIAHQLLGKTVNTAQEAQKILVDLDEYLDSDLGEEFTLRENQLKSETGYITSKDRIRKQALTEKDKQGREQTIYSKNTGVMTSNTPNFYNELSENPQVNRIVDTSALKGFVTGYSNQNKRNAFVGSISGHAYSLVLALLDYIQNTPRDPSNFATDVQNFIHAFTAYYINTGYHSYGEMMDVMTHELVLKKFSDHGIILNFDFPAPLLEHAFKDTQQYTVELCLRRALNDEHLKKIFSEPLITALQDNDQQAFALLNSIPPDQLLRVLKLANLDSQTGRQLAEHAKNTSDGELTLALVQLSPNFFGNPHYSHKLLRAVNTLKARDLFKDNDLRRAILTNPDNVDLIVDAVISLKERHLWKDDNVRLAILANPAQANNLSYAICELHDNALFQDNDIRRIILADPYGASNFATIIVQMNNNNLFAEPDLRQMVLINPKEANKIYHFITEWGVDKLDTDDPTRVMVVANAAHIQKLDDAFSIFNATRLFKLLREPDVSEAISSHPESAATLAKGITTLYSEGLLNEDIRRAILAHPAEAAALASACSKLKQLDAPDIIPELVAGENLQERIKLILMLIDSKLISRAAELSKYHLFDAENAPRVINALSYMKVKDSPFAMMFEKKEDLDQVIQSAADSNKKTTLSANDNTFWESKKPATEKPTQDKHITGSNIISKKNV